MPEVPGHHTMWVLRPSWFIKDGKIHRLNNKENPKPDNLKYGAPHGLIGRKYALTDDYWKASFYVLNRGEYITIIDQLYWSPPYLGMRSIPQGHWQKQDGLICIPEGLVNKTGPLYRRERKISELKTYLNGSEEILNHIFDLTFSIAPDSMINDILLKPLGFNDSGPFESIGRESAKRYGWGDYNNITQHDGFFVTEQSAVGVEIKLLSKSSPEQIAKYAALITWEELHTGLRKQIGLLFVVTDFAIKSFWRKSGLDGPFVNGNLINTDWKRRLPQAVLELFAKHREHVASVFDG